MYKYNVIALCVCDFWYSVTLFLCVFVSFWSVSFTFKERIWPPAGRSLPAWPPPRARTLQDHQYMICTIILTLGVVWTAVLCKAIIPRVCTLQCDPLRCVLGGVGGGSKVTAKELWPGKRLWRCCVSSVLSLTTVAVALLQVNSERRRPSFTRSLKRNARSRTARRPTESQADQVKKR